MLSTSTLVDRIAATDNLETFKSDVIKTTCSDHCLIYCNITFRGAFRKEHKYIISLKMKNFDEETFLSEVSNLPWDNIVRSCVT